MTVTQRRYVRRIRPVVFISAMIAPAALAVGVLMAELAGYQEAARGSIADHGEQAVAQAEQRSATEDSTAEVSAGPSNVSQAPGEGPTFTSRTDLGGGLPDHITMFEPTAAPPIAPRRGHPGGHARTRSATAEDGGADPPRAHPEDAPAATASPSPAPGPRTSPSVAPKTGPDGTSAAGTAEQHPGGQHTARDQATPGIARDSALRIGGRSGGTAGVTGGVGATGAVGTAQGAAGATNDRAANDRAATGRGSAADRAATDRTANGTATNSAANSAANGAAKPAPGSGSPANQAPADRSPTAGADATAATTLGGQAGEEQQAVSVTAGRGEALDPTWVPEPLGPALVYGGLIRISQQTPVRQAPVVKQRPKAVPRSEPATVETPLTCAAEWRDTWLWELCRERIGAALSAATGNGSIRTHLSGQAPSDPTKRPKGA